jgi:diguanylate cyclase (GGDEF)-like protein/PAS domain S-box-containing protein
MNTHKLLDQPDLILQLSQFAMENVSIEIYWVGSDARIHYANNQACIKLGYTKEEFQHLTISDLDPNYPMDLWPSHWQELKKDKTQLFETHHQRKDGVIFPVEVVANYVSLGGHEFNVGFAKDISERKRNEKELNRAKSIIDSSDDAIIGKSITGIIESWNEGAVKLFGYTSEEIIGLPMLKLVPADRQREDADILNRISLGERVEHIETIRQHKDGRLLDISTSISPILDEAGKVVGASTIARDITQNKRLEAILKRESEKNLALLLHASDGIHILDQNGTLVEASDSFCSMLGYQRNEMLGQHVSLWDAKLTTEEISRALTRQFTKQSRSQFETLHRRKDGSVFDVEISGAPLVLEGKQLLFNSSRDITDRKLLEQRQRLHEEALSKAAHYDQLTGLPNRILLADRMKQAISQTSRDQTMLAICYLDLDGFKPINDTLGHEVGDAILVEVSRRIETTIRGGDSVARLGGDEFVILLLGLARGDESQATLERLLKSISEPIEVQNTILKISASIGVSFYPMDNEDPDTLMRHADQAMYVAKESGKNRFHIYDMEMDKRARSQIATQQAIRLALELNQFELFYQPKIDLRTYEMMGAEALIRWRHPVRGLLSPSEFLHFVENTDLDIAIGDWVIATALAQVHAWHKSGLKIAVSINISGYHLESPSFANKIKLQFSAYPKLPTGTLQIEVLETVALNDVNSAQAVMGDCRRLGVRFALDDFGTGFSSLSYLNDLPVDALKIDQTFVRDMLEDAGDKAIVTGVIALAKAFGRQTVAEGIESHAHIQVLERMGCEYGQGYAIARPMTASELFHWKSK